MAVCENCGREMTEATSCVFVGMIIEETIFERIFFGAEPVPEFVTDEDLRAVPPDLPCHDCECA